MIVLRNTAPVVVSYPRVDIGTIPLLPPTSPTFRMSSAAVAWPDETATPSTGAVDTANVILTSAALVGVRELYCTPTTLTAGRQYLLTDTDGTIVVEVVAKDASRAFLAAPLPRGVSDSARLVGWAITATLTTAQTRDVGPALVQFSCNVGGVAVSWTEALRVARRVAIVPLTATQLVVAYPEVKQLHARQDETLEQLITSAWEHELMPRVLRRGTWPEDILNADALRPLLAMACMVRVYRSSRKVDDVAMYERFNGDFDRLLENTVARIDWHVEPQDTPIIPLAPSEDQRAARHSWGRR
jgi:hypothetical protein